MKKKTKLMLLVGLFIIFSIALPANAASSGSKKDPIVGCTIRTVEQTSGYSSSSSYKKILNIPANKKLEVLSSSNGRFRVSYKNKKCWISNSRVLVNIVNFIPHIDVRLDMAQDKNYFSMGNESISGLTNRRFYTSKGARNGTEAWLRYEPAKKLKSAQSKFLKKGYCIVIFDAYRPYSATQQFQKLYRNWLNTKSYSFKSKWFGQLGEGWFLAQNASAHNYGVAIDMTLKKISTEKLVAMPSRMHTLDIRSAYNSWSKKNTPFARNARYLKSTMESVGFTYLLSEWWHFQDNSTYRGSVINIAN